MLSCNHSKKGMVKWVASFPTPIRYFIKFSFVLPSFGVILSNHSLKFTIPEELR